MKRDVAEILKAALTLPLKERAALAKSLVASLAPHAGADAVDLRASNVGNLYDQARNRALARLREGNFDPSATRTLTSGPTGGSCRMAVTPVLSEAPAGEKGYPAISPAGDVLAYGLRLPGGERARRPIVLAGLRDGTSRTLGDDCGGRPREWIDQRRLIIERFARLNSIALIDTETGDQHDVLVSEERSIRNPRLSADRRWIAFDASRPGEPSEVALAPFRGEAIPESAWTIVERRASHPFWSADGRVLYYTPTGTNPLIRSAIRGRQFDTATGLGEGDPMAVYASNEMVMPAYLAGTAPLATPDAIILVLGDFRGDIWLMELAPDSDEMR